MLNLYSSKQANSLYEKLLNAHHQKMYAGVAIAVRLYLELPKYFQDLSKLEIYSGLNVHGCGFIDSFNYLIDGIKWDLNRDFEKEKDCIPSPNGGAYRFDFSAEGKTVSFKLKRDYISSEFVRLSRLGAQGHITDREYIKLLKLRQDLATLILEADFDLIFTTNINKN